MKTSKIPLPNRYVVTFRRLLRLSELFVPAHKPACNGTKSAEAGRQPSFVTTLRIETSEASR